MVVVLVSVVVVSVKAAAIVVVGVVITSSLYALPLFLDCIEKKPSLLFLFFRAY